MFVPFIIFISAYPSLCCGFLDKMATCSGKMLLPQHEEGVTIMSYTNSEGPNQTAPKCSLIRTLSVY